MKLFNVVLLMFACLSGIFSPSAFAQQKLEQFETITSNNNDFSKDTIHVVGHAHMDMKWLWTYFETMKMCNDNLRQTVAFMEEFPDFTMIQSQAAVYKFVEMVDPPLFEKVKQYVKEGRLELGGGMWTEGDTNLSSGEALSRSFLLGQRYFQNHFDRIATVGWLPDNFGHVSQLPQILKLAGEEKRITLNLFKDVESARKLNLIERPISGNPSIIIKDNSVSVEINPHEILTLGIKMK